MQAVKEKVSNMASKAKEKMTMCRARMEERTEVTAARTKEEKVMAHERRKAKEAQAKMELHQEKARHAANKQNSKLPHHHHNMPLGRMGRRQVWGWLLLHHILLEGIM
ncbi:hypothetical protein QQ045_007054 [Rhodiola kirilowii]